MHEEKLRRTAVERRIRMEKRDEYLEENHKNWQAKRHERQAGERKLERLEEVRRRKQEWTEKLLERRILPNRKRGRGEWNNQG